MQEPTKILNNRFRWCLVSLKFDSGSRNKKGSDWVRVADKLVYMKLVKQNQDNSTLKSMDTKVRIRHDMNNFKKAFPNPIILNVFCLSRYDENLLLNAYNQYKKATLSN